MMLLLKIKLKFTKHVLASYILHWNIEKTCFEVFFMRLKGTWQIAACFCWAISTINMFKRIWNEQTPLKMKANFIGNKKIDKKILREMLSQAKLRCQVRYGRGLEEVRFSCKGRILTK